MDFGRMWRGVRGAASSSWGGYRVGVNAALTAFPYNVGLAWRQGGLRRMPSVFGMTYGSFVRRMPRDNRFATAGYFGGLASPILAGAAVYSGLANLRRGRYGRALMLLGAGAGLTGLMGYSSLLNWRDARTERMWNQYEEFRRQADFDL